VPSPREQLDEMISRFSPPIASLVRSALPKLRRLLPGAVELVYDNSYALVIGFSATDRASEAIISIAAYPKKVALCFLWGALLADPEGRLQGGGRQVRHIRLNTASDLDDPGVKRLIRAAAEASETPFDPVRKRGEMQIRAISANRRPRRPGTRTRAPAATRRMPGG
jgi:hypothetical protein